MKFDGLKIQSKSHLQFLSFPPSRKSLSATFRSTPYTASLPYCATLALTAFLRLSSIDLISGSLPLNVALKYSISPAKSILSSGEEGKETPVFFASPSGDVSLFPFTLLFFTLLVMESGNIVIALLSLSGNSVITLLSESDNIVITPLSPSGGPATASLSGRPFSGSFLPASHLLAMPFFPASERLAFSPSLIPILRLRLSE